MRGSLPAYDRRVNIDLTSLDTLRRLPRLLIAALCLVVLGAPAPAAGDPITRVLVRFAAGTSPAQRADMRSRAGVQREAMLALRGLELVAPKAGVSVGQAVSGLARMPGVLYAEPDAVRSATAVPNDPGYPQQWGLPVINAPAAWDVTTGAPQVTVAIVDTGIDATDADLAPNIWTNPGESGGGRETNGVDDDADGRIDDVHGWDFVSGDNQPQDGNGHGTHVAGTIGARGNDGVGIAGVTWSTSLMALRILNNNGVGSVSAAISAYALAARDGARVLNASLGGTGYSQAEHDAIAAAPNTLFVVAAGNSSDNDDASAEYPCDYDLPNLICVAASDHDDSLASFSNYGATTVDLAAPGVGVLSTLPGNTYSQADGTSVATPFVSGAAALLLARNPAVGVAGVRAALLGSVTKVPALAGLVASGGRLDVSAALAAVPAPPPPAPAPAATAVQPPASGTGRSALSVALRILGARLRVVRGHGLRVSLTVSRACRVSVVLKVGPRTQQRLHLRSRVLGRARVRLRAAGKRSVTVHLSARAARALRRVSRLSVIVLAVATDAAGHRREIKRAVTLIR
jgi:subtilisin family serine protease